MTARLSRPAGRARALRTTISRAAPRQSLGLAAALVASGVVLLAPAGRTPPSSDPVPRALAWPGAVTGTIPATLPDGSAYEPLTFLDARTSVGTAADPDARTLQLVLRRADATTRILRRAALTDTPSFPGVTAAGDVLVWAERRNTGPLQLWTVDLGDDRPARQVTNDAGELLTNDSQYDLDIADGRVRWAAADPVRADVVQIRSVALTGGPVESRAEPGTWRLSAWPWLVDGATTPRGTTKLRNTATGVDVDVDPADGLTSTSCSPSWCRVFSTSRDGATHVELKRPDGSRREQIPGDALLPAITDVTPLDRFEVLSRQAPDTDVTRTGPLLVYEIATRRTVELSPDAAGAFYGHGVLWWTNGNQKTTWHTVDLRTI